MSSPSPAPPVSAAEQTRERAHRRAALSQSELAAGALHRRASPRSRPDVRWGVDRRRDVVVAGESIRLAGVAAAGTVTRRRSRDVQRLVTYGVFGWVRNPLYVGNFLIWMGFAIISGVYWFLPLAIVIFAIEYSLIVRYEEGVLESIFGAEYLAYKQTTPRWIPRPPVSARRGSARLARSMAERGEHLSTVRGAGRRSSRSRDGGSTGRG